MYELVHGGHECITWECTSSLNDMAAGHRGSEGAVHPLKNHNKTKITHKTNNLTKVVH